MSKIMFKLISLIFECIECFILNFPACSATTHDIKNIFFCHVRLCQNPLHSSQNPNISKKSFHKVRKKTLLSLYPQKKHFIPSTPPNSSQFSKKHIEYESKLTQES